MGFLGMFNVYSLRTNLNVAIVAMVNTTDDSDSQSNQSNLCPDRGQSSSDTANSVSNTKLNCNLHVVIQKLCTVLSAPDLHCDSVVRLKRHKKQFLYSSKAIS